MRKESKGYKPHWSFFIKSMIFGGGGGLLFLLASPLSRTLSVIISMFFFQWPLRIFLKWLGYKWIIGEEELIIKSGFLIKKEECRIPFHEIHNFALDQRPIGTILNYGSVLLSTSTKMGDVWLHHVPKPRNFIAEIYRKLSYS